jgi:hypothetical protein
MVRWIPFCRTACRRHVRLVSRAGKNDSRALIVGPADADHVELFLIQHLPVIGIALDARSELGHLGWIGIGYADEIDIRQPLNWPENFAHMTFHAGHTNSDFLRQPQSGNGRGGQ